MLTLYHGHVSVCSQKVRYCLAEKGVAYESKLIDVAKGEQFDPAYRKLNRNAVVPTIVHGGRVMIESSVIVQYIDDAFPGPALMPADDFDKGLARIWLLRNLEVHDSINAMSNAIVNRAREMKRTADEREADLRRIPSVGRIDRKRDLLERGLDSPYFAEALDRLAVAMADMEADLARSEWLVGDAVSLADIGLIAYIDRLNRLGMNGFWADRPGIAAWYERMKARPSYTAAIVDFMPGRHTTMQELGTKAWPEIAARLKAA